MHTLKKQSQPKSIVVTGLPLLAIIAGLLIGTDSVASTGGVLCSASKSSKEASQTQSAMIGKKAPEFALSDLAGRTIRLSQFKGKIVVLEWFNPDCPFVNLAHGRSLSLKDKAREYAKKGVVWLAINSNGPGKQGHGDVTNKRGKKRFRMDYPVLLDPTGKVGRAYGAVRTPHLFVIDSAGTLVYNGAIDNTRGGDPDDADPPPAANHVDTVLSTLFKKETPKLQKTEPWGCTVKYAK